jgi:large subunit ribosomal protein L13
VEVKTFVTKPGSVEREWLIVDAEGQTLGRLASQVAAVLRGKHKPQYSPAVDVGDFVIVVNAEKIRVTGRKLLQKKYYRHSGYPGGLSEITLADQLERHPTRVVKAAVRGMLPRNRLGRRMVKKLKVYAGTSSSSSATQAIRAVMR